MISLVLLTIFAIYTDQRGLWKVYSALCQVLQDTGVTSRLCTVYLQDALPYNFVPLLKPAWNFGADPNRLQLTC